MQKIIKIKMQMILLHDQMEKMHLEYGKELVELLILVYQRKIFAE
jgi:hypothetical protein